MPPASFQKLETALTNHDFETADGLTRQLMCELAGQSLPVTPQIIEKIPEKELSRIDELWSGYSDGRFGLGVQATIWIEIGGPVKIFKYEDMPRYQRWSLAEYEFEFGHQIGWAEKPRPMREKQGWGWIGCTYDVDSATRGALPYGYLICSYGFGLVGLVMAAVAARFSD